MTHHSATVRGGQVVVRGLDVPDGTRVTITIEPRALVAPPGDADLDRAFQELDRNALVTREESDQASARLHAAWARREQHTPRGAPDSNRRARSKGRGAVVARDARSPRAESPRRGVRAGVRPARRKASARLRK